MVKDPLIHSFIEGVSREDFEKEGSVVFSAVVRELEVIGEAASHLPEDFQKQHANIPWKKIIGMRQHLVHGYFQINMQQVWKAATEDVSQLQTCIDELLNAS